MEKTEIKKFLELQENYTIIDVRTPAEFADGHIPEAINLPIFTNDERAEVGTIYKRQTKEKAVIRGLEIVGTKLAYFAKRARKLATDNKILVHCWRGGMRSSSMAWLFETVGLQVYVLEGGYKAYRAFVRQSFTEAAQITILSGKTGSGKTEIIQQLQTLGEQTIDLEGMANHKGSAFGSIGEKRQPSTEQFENNLYPVWAKLNKNKRIWVEDESLNIGKVILPEPFFKQMREAPVLCVHVPHTQRVIRLVEMYGQANQQELIDSVNRISKRLGSQQAISAIDAINDKRLDKAVEVILPYYDKTYGAGLKRRDPGTVRFLDVPDLPPLQTAEYVLSNMHE